MTKKATKSIAFTYVSRNQGGHLEASERGDTKLTTRSGRQRAPQGIREKPLFSLLILRFLLFGIHLVAAPVAPFTFKMNKKALIL